MRILTWNALGGSSAELAAVLPAHNIDLCVLQEVATEATDPWYQPLHGIAGYSVGPPIVENEPHQLPGGVLAPAEGNNRAYAIVWNSATVTHILGAELVDYTQDSVWGPKTPREPFDAAQQGYNQRPPLGIQLPFEGVRTTVFTWHAPQSAMWNPVGLRMFDASGALRTAAASRTVIAGDLNTEDPTVNNYFSAFKGVQQGDSKIDFVLANTTLAKVNEIPGINLHGGDHWALAATVTW